MSRWAPDADRRLHAAALQLFLSQGFSETTVPQIAERAGMTTRSFFRYYADKREVLFAGEEELPGVVRDILAHADAGYSVLEVIRYGFQEVLSPRFESLREILLTRRTIVESDEGLQERELRKLLIVRTAAIDGFRDRGMTDLEAEIAGRLATTIYDTAMSAWLATDGKRSFGETSSEVVDRFAAVISLQPATTNTGTEPAV
jgi:AcrR family transcriptional regulator